MKKKVEITMKKSLITMCSVFGILFLSGTAVQAKEVKEYNINQSYYIDLDGDGTTENVCVKKVENNSDDEKALIYINDTLTRETEYGGWYFGFTVTDIDVKDSYKEIIVRAQTDSDCTIKTTAYRYKDGQLTKYFEFGDYHKLFRRSEIYHDQPGNGKVRIMTDTPFKFQNSLGCYYVYFDCKVVNGKLKNVNDSHIYNVVPDKKMTYKLTQSLNVRKSIKNGKTKFTFKKKTVCYLKKVYVSKRKICYIYLEQKGNRKKKGWVKIPKKQFYKGKEGMVYIWG